MNKPSPHSSPSRKLVTFFLPSLWNNPSVAIAMMDWTHFCPVVIQERSQRRSAKVMSSLTWALWLQRSERLVGNVRMAKRLQPQHGPPEGLMSSCIGAERERHDLKPTAGFHALNSINKQLHGFWMKCGFWHDCSWWHWWTILYSSIIYIIHF